MGYCISMTYDRIKHVYWPAADAMVEVGMVDCGPMYDIDPQGHYVISAPERAALERKARATP